MKNKKYLLFIPIIAILISLVFVFRTNEKYILLLGNMIDIKPYLEEKINDCKIDDTLCLSNMKSKDLVYYLENNATLNVDKKKMELNTLIKKSETVIVNIGLVDLLSKITIDKYESSISYDVDAINLTFSLLEQNLFKIINHIKLTNDKTKVIVCSYDDPFYFLSKNDEGHKMIEVLNSLMNSISSIFNEFYLENKLENIKYYSDKNYCLLNEDGKRKIAENIYQKIIAINT